MATTLTVTTSSSSSATFYKELYSAAYHGRVDDVKKHLEQGSVDVNAGNVRNENALFAASQNGHTEGNSSLISHLFLKYP